MLEGFKLIKAALLGAGSRGMYAYGSYALERPNEIKFIAIAEPNDYKREQFSKKHNIPKDMQFKSWDELLNKPKLCEAILICTQDRDHYKPTMKALDLGYDILLEKPMSPDPHESLQMAEKASETNQILTVCHVLRYSTFFSELKKIVDNKEDIGDIMTINWTENVGYYHQAHSFVRGNWRNSEESSSMLLQKCCHDMDLIQWLVDKQCEKISSFGSLSYFKESYAPEGSAERCIDCAVEQDCVYSALKWYYNDKEGWPGNTVEPSTDLKKRLEAIKTGRYGKCVYRSDNDVVDHQVVNMQFDGDVTVAFTMSAFNKDQCRTFQIGTTKAEIIGSTLTNEITIKYYNGKRMTIRPEEVMGGHGGADTLIMRDFVKQVNDRSIQSKTSAMESAKSHLLVFAAEESRLSGNTIEMESFVNKLKQL